MFYCGPCATEKGWPNDDYLPTSWGACEMCDYPSRCFDVPSSHLPLSGDTSHLQLTASQVAQNEELEAIRSIKRTIKERS